ncbi:PTS sugar transporter subunit IIA [Psychromonas marina]|uniref:PTS sugar transporter subunit IIA n=1 Tax=Psychromonas marina TaxID=88364 RepID=A0ABQ6DX89_9GAMM|nr:DUF3389 domain-containing protein [Psychromonas marina]GLS89744.1 PTS sugar transporter subunit IIA [Psychromonas marina]
MIITFSQGKVIANQREVMIKLEGDARITLQAQVDELELIGAANVITAVGSGLSWSLRLDDGEQLQNLSTETGIAIKHR